MAILQQWLLQVQTERTQVQQQISALHNREEELEQKQIELEKNLNNYHTAVQALEELFESLSTAQVAQVKQELCEKFDFKQSDSCGDRDGGDSQHQSENENLNHTATPVSDTTNSLAPGVEPENYLFPTEDEPPKLIPGQAAGQDWMTKRIETGTGNFEGVYIRNKDGDDYPEFTECGKIGFDHNHGWFAWDQTSVLAEGYNIREYALEVILSYFGITLTAPKLTLQV